MKPFAMQRWGFTGMLYIPKVDPDSQNADVVLVYEKDIKFNFTGDPSTPRSVLVSPEPFPTTAVITFVRNKYEQEVMPLSEWTVTSVEPILDPFGRVGAYRHQVALREPPDFGYDVVRGT